MTKCSTCGKELKIVEDGNYEFIKIYTSWMETINNVTKSSQTSLAFCSDKCFRKYKYPEAKTEPVIRFDIPNKK